MKFLIFNIAVLLSLGILIFGKPEETSVVSSKVSGVVHALKAKLYEAAKPAVSKPRNVASDPKTKTLIVNKQGFAPVSGKREKETVVTNPEKVPMEEKRIDAPNQKNPEQRVRKPIEVQDTVVKTDKKGSVAHLLGNTHKTKAAIRNRSDVNKVLANKTLKDKQDKVDGELGFMSDSDRRRDLMTLSDEMEEVHARSFVD